MSEIVAAWQPATARALVRAAATALGGVQRVRAVRNITLAGHGQYAYMFGGGRITGSPEAPEKFIAADDLRRIYDLEHGRFRQSERRTPQFPFPEAAGHGVAPNDVVLDGDLAYDLSTQVDFGRCGPTRAARWSESPLFLDGVHMRRMWMLNNPIVLVRSLMEPGTRLSEPRSLGDDGPQLDVALDSDERLRVGFGADDLPAWVRWSNPQTNLGQITFTTYLTGYASFDGLLLPLGYDTRLDWRDVDYLKLYVDDYGIDQPMPDLAAPPEVRSAPEPPSYPALPVSAEPLAEHLWRLSPGGSTLIEFADHLTLFGLPVGTQQARAVIARARALVPGKPVTQLIVSHHHFDHTAGLRQAVAEGLTIIARGPHERIFQEMVAHPAADFPDDLAHRPQPLRFMPIHERLELADDTLRLSILWARNNVHRADGVVAYAPAQKLIIAGEVSTMTHQQPDVLTIEQVDELLRDGTRRTRARCAAVLATGSYFPGSSVRNSRH